MSPGSMNLDIKLQRTQNILIFLGLKQNSDSYWLILKYVFENCYLMNSNDDS